MAMRNSDSAASMTTILCGAHADRTREIRTVLADVGTTVEREYSSTSVFLSTLPELGSDAVDLIVIDRVVEPMNVWDFTHEVAAKIPSAAVVLVLDRPTPDDYARAMDSGARAVISYPLNFEDVAQKISSASSWVTTVRSAVRRRISDESGPEVQGSMITLAAAKGGTGCSTLALHLAIEARRADPLRSVVVVDMDLQKPDLAILLNIPQHRDITDLLGVVDELTPRQLNDVLFTHEQGYSVLFGPRNGEEAELVTEHAARQILGMLRSRFDLVIVDIGSVLGEANSSAAEMADEAYIVSTSDVLSLRGVRRLDGLWARLGVRKTGSAQVILNKTDRRSDIQPAAATKIVGLPVVDVHVPESMKSIELAVNRRDPGLVAPTWSSKVRQLGAAMKIISEESLTLPEPTRRPKRGDRRKKNRREKAEAGQSTIEFLGVFVLILVTAAIGFQALLTGATWMFAAHSANAGARAAAVGQSAEAAAFSRTPSAWQEGMSVRTSGGTVEVTMRTPLLVPVTEDFVIEIPASAGIVEEP
ncbi:pilus assembly protein CpaE [Brevibacterium pityocampae]